MKMTRDPETGAHVVRFKGSHVQQVCIKSAPAQGTVLLFRGIGSTRTQRFSTKFMSERITYVDRADNAWRL